MLDFVVLYNIDIKEEKQKKEIFNVFEQFLEENQNLIASFFKETSNKCNQPNYDDCIYAIKSKINEIVFNLLEPCLSLNYKINSLVIKNSSFKKKFNYRKILTQNYNNYIINLDEIMNSIKKTKYHSDSKLNSLFQIKAFNYIINNNSKFVLFILELYKTLYEKKKKLNYEFNINENIKEKFEIKIEKGEKYTKNDFDILKKKKEENIKKIKEIKDSKKSQLKHKEKVQYKLCKYDTDIEYNDNIFPFEASYYYNGKQLKNQEIIKFNIHNNGKKRKKHYLPSTNDFINIYDLIFTVKNIDESNIITLEQNDISEILENYSDKETFNSLLNQNFSIKTEEELKIDTTSIKLYLKGNKFNK